MKDWEYHYKVAEELLRRSDEPAAMQYARAHLLRKAQVHATLATIKYER